MKNLKNNARYLRKNQTEQERKLWNLIKNKQFYNYKFLRQYVIGKYIVDFICREKKIIIEIDGGQHNENSTIDYDKERSIYLNSIGYTVIRFWNNEIDNNIEGVYSKLEQVFDIKNQHPPLILPQQGGKFTPSLMREVWDGC